MTAARPISDRSVREIARGGFRRHRRPGRGVSGMRDKQWAHNDTRVS